MHSTKILEATSKSKALKMSKRGEVARSDSYITSYEPRNWYTARGASKMFAYFEKKGFPNCSDFRFITLTVDNNKYLNAQDAYEKTKGQVRRFLCALRKKYGHFIWFKKLEFTKNEFPHWHLIVGIKHKIDLDFVNKAWGRGRTNVERIDSNSSNDSLQYIFKYVSKGGELPAWVLDYSENIRFSENSSDFFTSKKEKPVVDDSAKSQSSKASLCKLSSFKIKSFILSFVLSFIIEANSYKEKPFKTIRERLNSWDNSFLLSVKDNDSEMFYRIPLTLKYGFKELENIIAESAKKYLFSKASDIEIFNASFLGDSLFTAGRKNSLRLKSFEMLAFLVANDILSVFDVPFFIYEKLKNYFFRFERYKKMAVTDKFIKWEYQETFDIYGNFQGCDWLPCAEHWDKYFEMQRAS